MWIGCAIRPTQRSVVARHLNNTLDGGWREDSLRRAIRIRVFPRKAVIDRVMSNAAININSPCIPSVKMTEQSCCENESVCFPPPVKFAFAIAPQVRSVVKAKDFSQNPPRITWSLESATAILFYTIRTAISALNCTHEQDGFQSRAIWQMVLYVHASAVN